jgi:hypothetical protein
MASFVTVGKNVGAIAAQLVTTLQNVPVDNGLLSDILSTLEEYPMTLPILERTIGLGRTVQSIRKVGSVDSHLIERSKALVRRWKPKECRLIPLPPVLSVAPAVAGGGGSGGGGRAPSASVGEAAVAISFNSKSKDWHELSNFYGGVEESYVVLKLPALKPLLERIKVCNGQQFLLWLKAFQPDKNDWNEAKERYWFDADGKPIRGVLAKLVANAFQGPASAAKKRRQVAVLAAMAGGAGGGAVQKMPMLVLKQGEESEDALYACLQAKYAQPKYRTILLSTGDAVLHERPMRGSGNNWTFPGGDKLGLMLCRLRSQIRDEISPSATK